MEFAQNFLSNGSERLFINTSNSEKWSQGRTSTSLLLKFSVDVLFLKYVFKNVKVNFYGEKIPDFVISFLVV